MLLDRYVEMIKKENENLDFLTGEIEQGMKGSMTLVSLVKSYNRKRKSEVGKTISSSTYKQYAFTERKLKAFLLYNGCSNIQVRDIMYQLIDDFALYILSSKKSCGNYAARLCSNLRRILNYAVQKKFISHNPFLHFKCLQKTNDRLWLSLEELERIRQANFPHRYLSYARDVFIFQCYTGLGYMDMKNLKKDNLVKRDGKNWIILKRLNNVRSAIPLLPESGKALARLQRYYVQALQYIPGALIPLFNVNRFNLHLAKIMKHCEIDRNITSQSGRKTFSRTIALAGGLSLESLSAMLGHTRVRYTQKHAFSSDLLVASDMKKIKKAMNGK
ncbi:MAG: recombinase [Chitinophagaceae bacterium]|nr:recombinase [Chitinophagaceae bacterium]